MNSKEKYRKRTEENKANGECLKCKQKAVKGKVLCQYHLDYNSNRQNNKKPFKKTKHKPIFNALTICKDCHNLIADKYKCQSCTRTLTGMSNFIEATNRRIDIEREIVE